jgi:thioesterase domain-containing protein
MSDLLHSTERFLHEQIPLTHAMGVRVVQFDEKGFMLTAPLEPNHNHLGTAFGGSLSAIATLAGYSLLWLELGDRNSHIVIKSSSLKYRRPIFGEIRAVCPRIDPETLAVFREKFARTDKAGIPLRVSIEEEGIECVEFEGLFVALR